jgi:hypothetical protein
VRAETPASEAAAAAAMSNEGEIEYGETSTLDCLFYMLYGLVGVRYAAWWYITKNLGGRGPDKGAQAGYVNAPNGICSSNQACRFRICVELVMRLDSML